MAEVRIEPITSASDIPICAQLCWEAVQDDPFITFLRRYDESYKFHEETITRLSDAINPENTSDFAFKAVIDVPDENGGSHEEIVGVTHWYYGKVIMSKYDPVTKEVNKEPNEISPSELAVGSSPSTGHTTPVNSSPPSKVVIKTAAEATQHVFRQHGNTYVGAVRGKKHIYLRRMMVSPKHQRKGIGHKLLQWGTDRADREKIVAYLNGRPAGLKLYEAAGFERIAKLEIIVPEGDEELIVPSGYAMLRQPRPITNSLQ